MTTTGIVLLVIAIQLVSTVLTIFACKHDRDDSLLWMAFVPLLSQLTGITYIFIVCFEKPYSDLKLWVRRG